MNENHTLESVKNYYGKVLSSSKDLKTSACCSIESVPKYLRPLLNKVHPEIRDRFYGCGAPIPHVLEGATVLDLGCGTGRDVYLVSQLVGETGKVIGIDMTDEQLEIARKYESSQMNDFGFAESNVEFKKGYIEDLENLEIESGSVDVVISNCVVNLSPEKDRVFREIFRVLKPGGELYFSDVYASRRLDAELREDPVLLGECLGGALYIEDFRRMIARTGCEDLRVIHRSPITAFSEEIQTKIEGIQFESVTARCFKLPLEDRCEDHGQVARYLGGILGAENNWALDDHHLFEKNRPMLVCGNTAQMLESTRFKSYFKVEGDRSKHFGLFDCASAQDSSATANDCC